MLVLFHVSAAMLSLLTGGLLLLRPSVKKLRIAYALTAATITSGTLLVVTKPSHILSVCISGLAYLAIVTACIIFARKRLAQDTAPI